MNVRPPSASAFLRELAEATFEGPSFFLGFLVDEALVYTRCIFLALGTSAGKFHHGCCILGQAYIIGRKSAAVVNAFFDEQAVENHGMSDPVNVTLLLEFGSGPISRETCCIQELRGRLTLGSFLQIGHLKHGDASALSLSLNIRKQANNSRGFIRHIFH
jgi:hypothetical protein